MKSALLDALEIPESERSHSEDEKPTGPGRRRARELRREFEVAFASAEDPLATERGMACARKCVSADEVDHEIVRLARVSERSYAHIELRTAFEQLYREHRRALDEIDGHLERPRRRR